MIFKKGFLLIELMISLFFLSIGVLFFASQYAHVGKLTRDTLQTYKKLMIIQSALEEARMYKKEWYKSYTVDAYTVEIHVMSDAVIKNFLHITITLYDEKGKKDVWSSGIAVPREV